MIERQSNRRLDLVVYRYTRRDFDRVMEFLRRAGEPRDLDTFSDFVLEAIPALVGADGLGMGTYVPANHWKLEGSRATPAEFAAPKVNALLERHVADTPFIPYYLATRPAHFVRWSDLQDFSQFRRTGLYNEVHRPFGWRDFSTLLFPGSPDLWTGVGIIHSRQISDRSRDMLVSISPHVVQAWRTAQTISALRDANEVPAKAGSGARCVVMVDRNGTIRMESESAAILLARYFEPRDNRRLPESLRRWVAKSDEAMRKASDLPPVRLPLTIERDGRRLAIHHQSNPEHDLLVLEETRIGIDPGALRNLGLSPRESEILGWIAEGKTNPEIAIILGVSALTVKKHVEHIFDRLGTPTRTAAAAMAFGANGAPV